MSDPTPPPAPPMNRMAKGHALPRPGEVVPIRRPGEGDVLPHVPRK
jgi:hypothetical protein